MGRRFKIFFLGFGCLLFGAFWGYAQTEQNSEALEMIVKRMKSLTQSLNGLPQPPAMDKTIQIPDTFFLKSSPNSKDQKDSKP